jgi:hypothetical protein
MTAFCGKRAAGCARFLRQLATANLLRLARLVRRSEPGEQRLRGGEKASEIDHLYEKTHDTTTRIILDGSQSHC